jgi:hypothetical protein
LQSLEVMRLDDTSCPRTAGGLKLASSIVRPAVVDLMDVDDPNRHDDIEVDEVRIEPGARSSIPRSLPWSRSSAACVTLR